MSDEKALAEFGLSGSITWLVERDDPVRWPLAREGWSVVSPMLYPRGGNNTDLCVEPGRLRIETDMLVIEIPADSSDGPDRLHDRWPEARRLLRAFRYVSGQATIPRKQTWFTSDRALDAGREVSWEPTPAEVMINAFHYDTALTRKHVEQANRLGPTYDVPPHSAVLLEAMEALVDDDYRRTQLYAAIACESCASSVLDDAYEAMRGGTSSAAHRFAVLGGPDKPKKDPVFELLRTTAKYKQLLHEVPLYLLGRSLLIERETLYRDLLRLAGTRNKLAHAGELD